MSSDDGFSLVEVLAVLLIAAILMAVAVPLLLGASHQGSAQVVEATLTSSITAANGSYTGIGSYAQLFSSGACSTSPSSYLSSRNNGIQYVHGAVTSVGPVSVGCVEVSGSPQLLIMVSSFSGGGSTGADCLAVAEAKAAPPNSTTWPKGSSAGTGITAGGPYYAIQTPSAAGCTPTSFKTATGWQSSWKSISIP